MCISLKEVAWNSRQRPGGGIHAISWRKIHYIPDPWQYAFHVSPPSLSIPNPTPSTSTTLFYFQLYLIFFYLHLPYLFTQLQPNPIAPFQLHRTCISPNKSDNGWKNRANIENKENRENTGRPDWLMIGKQRKRGKQRLVHEYQTNGLWENKENRENGGFPM